MKRLLLLVLPVFIGSMLFSQSNQDDLQIIQSLFGKEKKAIVAEFIQANPASNDLFWGWYDEYEMARKELGRKRMELLVNYVKNYGTLTDEQTDETMSQIIAQQKAMDKLIVTYYHKMRKDVGAKQAAQFYQLEYYFLNAIRSYIFENIPFIGELEIE